MVFAWIPFPPGYNRAMEKIENGNPHGKERLERRNHLSWHVIQNQQLTPSKKTNRVELRASAKWNRVAETDDPTPKRR
jgi:hypothetical protein